MLATKKKWQLLVGVLLVAVLAIAAFSCDWSGTGAQGSQPDSKAKSAGKYASKYGMDKSGVDQPAAVVYTPAEQLRVAEDFAKGGVINDTFYSTFEDAYKQALTGVPLAVIEQRTSSERTTALRELQDTLAKDLARELTSAELQRLKYHDSRLANDDPLAIKVAAIIQKAGPAAKTRVTRRLELPPTW